MRRALLASALCVVLCAAPFRGAAKGVSGATTAEARIVDSGGIEVISPLYLPSVSLSPGPVSVSGNQHLTVRGDAGDVLSMAIPSVLTLVRDGGSEVLNVETTTYGLAGSGVLYGGALINGAAMSVDIGGTLALASADHLVPGPYEGLFVVVVQYN